MIASRSQRRVRGHAALELVAIAPFLLVLMAAVWDLRQFTAHRTDLARELYVVSEILAAGGDWDGDALAAGGEATEVLERVRERMRRSGAGWAEAAVVRQGRSRDAGTPCPEGADGGTNPQCCPAWNETDPRLSWCLPMAGRRFARLEWGGQGDCANRPSGLPAEGDHFGAGAAVLANERAGEGSVSRLMAPREWWVVIESCSHFGEGDGAAALLGALWDRMPALGVDVALVRRAVWASADDVGECDWCELAPEPEPEPET